MATNESPDPSVSLLKEKIALIERQSFSNLLALVVISGTLTGYLYRQASVLHKDIDANQQVINAVNDNRKQMSDFLNQLGAFGQTHPDFEQQVMIKNGLVPPPPSAARK
jgi:hypothetical protein